MTKLYSITQDSGIDLTPLVADFLDDLDRRGYSDQTIRAYKSAFNRLTATLVERPISSITTRDLV
jgi:site-specific recombinase XerD